jgi:ribonuclease J
MNSLVETCEKPALCPGEMICQKLRVIPLGGVGEIGMNSLVLEYGNDIIMIDCGHMCPESDMPGIDLVIPDFSYLLDKKDSLKGIFLTHGHDDHIGALSYILPQLPTPVYGTPLTLGFVRVKLKEYNLLDETDLIEITPRERIQKGPFTIIPFRVTHSIADSVGFIIETPVGNLIFSGDYKFEPHPTPGDHYDIHTVASYGEKGVLALFADSTNVERKGSAPSESEVTKNLDLIFSKTKQTLVVSSFASSIYRIQSILDLAIKYDRDIFVTGLNMVRNIQIARDTGYLKVPASRLRELREIENCPPQNRLLLSTGSQGEPLSVMYRLAMDNFKWLKLTEGDTVILSARMIPGNEKSILNMINHLTRRGADVYYEWIEKVHSSGHAYRDDMKHLLQLTRPEFLIPVHGEYRHLKEHKNLAIDIGMRESCIHIIEDGMIIEFDGNNASITGKVPSGRIFVDGKSVGDVGDVVLRDRRHLARGGILTAFLTVDSTTGELLTDPYIVTRGFIYVDENEDLLNAAKELIVECYSGLNRKNIEDLAEVKTELRRVLKKFFKKECSRIPMILPVVIEI